MTPTTVALSYLNSAALLADGIAEQHGNKSDQVNIGFNIDQVRQILARIDAQPAPTPTAAALTLVDDRARIKARRQL